MAGPCHVLPSSSLLPSRAALCIWSIRAGGLGLGLSPISSNSSSCRIWWIGQARYGRIYTEGFGRYTSSTEARVELKELAKSRAWLTLRCRNLWLVTDDVRDRLWMRMISGALLLYQSRCLDFWWNVLMASGKKCYRRQHAWETTYIYWHVSVMLDSLSIVTCVAFARSIIKISLTPILLSHVAFASTEWVSQVYPGWKMSFHGRNKSRC